MAQKLFGWEEGKRSKQLLKGSVGISATLLCLYASRGLGNVVGILRCLQAAFCLRESSRPPLCCGLHVTSRSVLREVPVLFGNSPGKEGDCLTGGIRGPPCVCHSHLINEYMAQQVGGAPGCSIQPSYRGSRARGCHMPVARPKARGNHLWDWVHAVSPARHQQ